MSKHCLLAVSGGLQTVTQFLWCYKVFSCMFLSLAEIHATTETKRHYKC